MMYVDVVMIAIGIALHFVLKLAELEKQGQIITPMAYWKNNPYTSLLVVLAAYLYFAWDWSTGPVKIGDAILIGIASNSLGDKLRARAEATIK